MSAFRLVVFLAGVMGVFCLPRAAISAKDLPEGFVVAEGSTSPDGRYGIVIPGRDQLPGDGMDVVNYLADVKFHRLVGEIRNGDYIEGENHRGLRAHWSADSLLCFAQYEDRYGFGSIRLLELNKNGFSQVEVGKFIQTSLDAVIVRKSHAKDDSCYAEFYCRFNANHTVRIRALGYTNPKQLEGVPTYRAYFRGTYEPETRKWNGVTTRNVGEECDGFNAAFRDKDFLNEVFSGEEDRAEALDKCMNDIYQALRFLLPAEGFSEVKKAQIAWLKKRDAADSTAAKCKLLEARIEVLRDIAWQ